MTPASIAFSFAVASCLVLVAPLAHAEGAPLEQASSPPPPSSVAVPRAPGAATPHTEDPSLDPFFAPACHGRRDDGSRSGEGCAGVFGLRAVLTQVRSARANGSDVSLAFSSEGEDYASRGLFSGRTVHRMGIGGGTAGFDGALLGSFTGGIRVPMGRTHGPVARVGAQGFLLGNGAFYSSLLELPRLEVGYQLTTADLVVEAGLSTGVALVGRYRAGDATSRTIGKGFDVGAYAAVQGPSVRLGVSLLRMPGDDELGTAIQLATGTFCFVGLLGAPIALCADARAMHADAVTPPGTDAVSVRSLYGGLTVGFTRER